MVLGFQLNSQSELKWMIKVPHRMIWTKATLRPRSKVVLIIAIFPRSAVIGFEKSVAETSWADFKMLEML